MIHLLSLVGFGLWIYSVIWIYNEEEGGDATLWAILTALFSVITLLVYGILHRSKPALILAGASVALGIVGLLAR